MKVEDIEVEAKCTKFPPLTMVCRLVKRQALNLDIKSLGLFTDAFHFSSYHQNRSKGDQLTHILLSSSREGQVFLTWPENWCNQQYISFFKGLKR